MKVLMRVGLLAILVSLISACGVFGPPDGPVRKKEQQGCARGTFDFDPHGGAQPLGSSELLYRTMLEALRSTETIPMLDLTHSAGWSDDWDRMVDVWEHTEQNELNSRAQTPGYCWKHLPASSPTSDNPSDGFYLFIKDQRPVQFVRYRISEYPIQLLRGVVVTKETVLVRRASYLRPE
ncbi:hypothetical protein [Nocardia sp. JMUB6875]|uniref:hypothetical protein n=1 Tax=Nocardia sp. JMUB6875 TaxID=3158170 RepID=UPI0034E89203